MPTLHRILICAAICLTGCANTKDVRSLADLTARKAETHQRQVDDFVAAQKDLNSVGAVELADFARATARARADNDLLIDRWRMADAKAELRQHQLLTAVGPQPILDALTVAETKPAALDVEAADKAMAKAGKSFKGLAKDPSFFEQAQSAWTVLEKVSAAVKDVSAAAAKDPSNGATAPKDASPNT